MELFSGGEPPEPGADKNGVESTYLGLLIKIKEEVDPRSWDMLKNCEFSVRFQEKSCQDLDEKAIILMENDGKIVITEKSFENKLMSLEKRKRLYRLLGMDDKHILKEEMKVKKKRKDVLKGSYSKFLSFHT